MKRSSDRLKEINVKQEILDFLIKLRAKTVKDEDHELIDIIEAVLDDDGRVELDFDLDAEDYDSDEDYEEEKPVNRDPTLSKFTLAQMKQMKEMKEKGWSFATIQTRFRGLTLARDLTRCIDYANKEGTKFMKFEEIREFVFQQFSEARNNFEPVHDRDLQDSALIKAKKCNFPDFKAGSHWLHGFKKRYRIGGRKITKLRTKKTRVDEEKLKQAIEEFQANLAPVLENVNPSNVFNTDQLGVNLELVEGRTLDSKGVKHVEVVVQRI